MDNQSKYFKFSMPRVTLIGVDAFKQLSDEIPKMKIRKVLIVTDKFMSESDILINVRNIVEKCGVEICIYDKVEPNPNFTQVKEGAYLFLKEKCNALISLGGGSPHDCAKAIKLTVSKSELWSEKRIRLIAINTTAGTASEMTSFAVITDEETHTKIPIVDTNLIPDVAVDDPMLMLDMPKGLTAATGMDALTHAIEAYVSTGSNYITDSAAIKAIELVDKYLVKAYMNGQDIEARDGMVYAQYLAGMAFSNAGLGLVHAMAHQLGGLYNLPHGLCNALLLPYVMAYNHTEVMNSYALIARKIGICARSQPDVLASKTLIRHVSELNEKLGIPKTLRELKVNYNDCGKLAEMAMEDVDIKSNPIMPKLSEVKEIYENAYHGILNPVY